ncbi:MAG TPA: hypothetical protein VFF59_04530 [Anaerolineae bacterium]|nr:hypothetical protein [Anaerolineae bacterium]
MPNRALVGLLTAALVLRVGLALLSPGVSYEMESYRIQAQAVLTGQNIYAATYRYPYPPLWMYWPAAAVRLSETLGAPFYFWIKLPAIVADLIIGALIFTWPRAAQAHTAACQSAWYLFNPIVLIVSVLHGQFDPVVTLGMLGAARAWLARRWLLSALSLSVAIALKLFPVLLLPLFLIDLPSWKTAVQYALVAVSTLCVICVPYLATNGTRLVGLLMRYTSTPDHSYSYWIVALSAPADPPVLPPLLARLRELSRWLQGGVALLAAAVGHVRGWAIERRVAVLLAGLYVVLPGLASQQMIWLVPFLVLTRPRWPLWSYTLISTVALVLFYGQHFPDTLWLPASAPSSTLLTIRLIVEAAWWLTALGVTGALITERSGQARPVMEMQNPT